MGDHFAVKAKKTVELKEITISLNPDHIARLGTMGKGKDLTAEEVLAQFVTWALETGFLGRKKKKTPTKPE